MIDNDLMQVVTNTPIIIYSLDRHGVFTLSEGLGLRKLGLKPGEVVGQSCLEIYADYPDIIETIYRALAGETVLLTHLVGETYFDNRMVPLYDNDGKIKGIVGSAIDISDLMKSKNQLQEKDRDLQKKYNELSVLHQEMAGTDKMLRAKYEELLRVNQQVIRRNTILSALEETTFNLLNKLDMEQLLYTIVKRAASIVGAEDAFIVLPSMDGKYLEVKAGIGIYREAIRFLPLGWGLMGKVYASGHPELIEDYQNWERRPDASFIETIRTIFAAPLYAKQKIAGVLGVAFCQQGQSFDEDQIELLKRFAELASLALENAALHASLQEELNERISSETTLHEIFNGVNEVIIINNPETGAILWANKRATEVFGYTEEELKEQGAVAISKPCNFEAAISAMRKAVSEGPQCYERETADKFGRPIMVEVNAKRAVIHGEVLCLTIMRDITEGKKIEKSLLKTETEKQAVLAAIPDTMLIFDEDGTVLEAQATPDFETPLPLGVEVTGMKLREMPLPEDVIRNYEYCISQALKTGKLQLYEYILDIRGAKRYREVRFTKVNSTSVLALLRDITEVRLSQEQVEFLRRHDVMTGVYDRTYFEEEISRASNQTVQGAAVVICDVDGLKLINDTLGHAAGDDVLRIVADALRKTFTADSDVIARIGGDEFAVVTYERDKISHETDVDAFVNSIAEYNRENPQLPVSVSVGWAADYDGSHKIDGLIKEADNMMYRHKMHHSQSMRSAIVQTMMKALEARDYITEGHADRLQELVELMGRKLQLSSAKLADLKLFAQFHDIGKVGIPDGILNKAGKLNDEEFSIMKSHSDIGYRIALASPDLAPIAKLVLSHHEWWNGGGYPLGIKGEEIPLECRILALADAYDAMTNDRPYRKALTHEKAIDEIRRCCAAQFDPNLVGLFIYVIKEYQTSDCRSCLE